jgi:hypothetical protein
MYIDGTVYIYEFTSEVHSAAARTLAVLVGQHPAYAHLSPRGDATCYSTNPVWALQPDESFVPRGLPRPAPNPSSPTGAPWPTVVLEVSLSTHLYCLYCRWLFLNS